MAKAKEIKKLELSLYIHDTPAALRFGSSGYFLTLAGTEKDKEKAAALLALNGLPLKVTIEVDYKELEMRDSNFADMDIDLTDL